MKKQSGDQKKLCVCLTPLHVLIASRVCEETGMKFDLGLYISYQRDKKQELYFQRMYSFCKRIEFIQTPPEIYPKGFKKYLELINRRQLFMKQIAAFGKFEYALASSSINHYLWCVIQKTSPTTLETYDDGLLNISTTPLSNYAKTPRLENFLLKLSGLHVNKEKMIERSLKHHSIYRDQNWYPRATFFSLYENKQPVIHKPQNSCGQRIFIGPAPEAPEYIWSLVGQYLSANPEALYLKHPREKEGRFPEAQILETDLIIEDYVIQQMRNTGCNFTITGTESSALINLSRIQNVNTQSILPNKPEFKESRNLMRKHGITLIHAQ